MSKNTRTELIIILDRSGSMQSIKKSTEKAFNDFIEEQKKLPGACTVSLYQFDDVYEKVFESKKLADVGPIEIHPRNGTALLDAIGSTINSLEERLMKIATEEEVPDIVVFCILSDGAENSSKEFDGASIKKMIEEKTNARGWKFMYFGTNQDAIATAIKYGIKAGDTISFAASAQGLSGTSVAMGKKMSAYRSSSYYSYTDEDRALAAGVNPPTTESSVTKQDEE